MTTKKKPYVLILDCHRGVYAGYLKSKTNGGKTVKLEEGRHAFYFTTTSAKGVFGLAVTGPQRGSKIGPKVNMEIQDVSKIVECSEEARKTWENATW